MENKIAVNGVIQPGTFSDQEISRLLQQGKRVSWIQMIVGQEMAVRHLKTLGYKY